MRLFGLVILLAAVAIVVFPAGMALGQEGINATRVLPDTVERGGTFNVTVTFTADGNNFSSITLNDHPPLGWSLTTDRFWCIPNASYAKPNANMTDLAWIGSWGNGTNFTVVYQVDVPGCNLSGNHSFYGGIGFYSDEYGGHEFQSVMGDSNVTVIPPAIRNTTSILFYAPPGQNPGNETLYVWSSTPCPLNWSLSDDAVYNVTHDWLEAYPTNGSCTNVTVPVALSVNTSGMPVGDYSANITINANATTNETANNSPQIVPVTLHITEFGILQGQVDFCRKQPAGDPTWETPLVVRFFNATTQNETTWSSINVITDAYGNFTMEDIKIGTYDIGIKNCTCLSKMVFGTVLTAGYSTYADFGTPLEGDCSDDDWVTSIDRGLLHQGWGTMNVIQDGHLCDLNRDGWLSSLDRGIMHENWGQGGDLQSY